MTGKKLVFMSAALLLLIGLGWYGSANRPVRIGYVGNLGSELGAAGQVGCQLAIEEANRSGGVNGRPVELVISSNGHKPNRAWQAVQELIDADVLAIIGHMTSEMSYSTRDLIERNKIVMLSPTNSTDLLTGQDDHFVRIYPAASAITAKLARYAKNRNLNNFSIIYDKTNYAYSQSWVENFSRDFSEIGGVVDEAIPFDANNMQSSFLELVRQIDDACVDGVLILANPMQTALIAQQFAKVDCPAQLFATEWSYSPTLLSFGGEAIEDLAIIQTYLPEALDPKSVALKNRLWERFRQDAWFAPAHAYDATRMVLAALERNDDKKVLRQTLVSLGAFSGVQSPIKLDKNGDVDRIYFIRKVSDGKVSLVAQL